MGGGKRNQAQRTKNNVKPSSSARSANLLGNDATKLVGLVNFGQNQLFSVDTSTEDDLGSIDPVFRVSFKKLTKKDAVTRRKGLIELSDLCTTSGKEACRSIASAWTRAYVILAQDVDNKVRAQAQETHHAVIKVANRAFGPHMRTIFPTWLLSQFDPYPPAASAAANSLNEIMAKVSLEQLIHWYKSEIFNHISDNLLNQTAQSLSKPDTSKDDMDAKYERVMLCSLLGYIQYIKVYANKDLEEFKAVNLPLITSTKFSRFASFKAPKVRGAWCSVVVELCKSAPSLVQTEGSSLAGTVFAALNEPDPAVLPQIWDAALHILALLKESCDRKLLEKIIFPFLKEGGRGYAAIVYPNLILLLSHFLEFTDDKNESCSRFFSALKTGLCLPAVKNKLSESKVIVQSLFECFRFVISKHSSDIEFCLSLVNDHLVSLTAKIISDPSFHTVSRYFLWNLSELISNWLKCGVAEQQQLGKKLLHLVSDTCNSVVEEVKTDPKLASYSFSCHAQLLESFFYPVQHLSWRSKNVRFGTRQEEEKCEVTMTMPDPIVMESLNGFWHTIAQKQWTIAESCCPAVRGSAAEALAAGSRLFGWPSHTLPEANEVCNTLHSWLAENPDLYKPYISLTFAALPSLGENIRSELLAKMAQEQPQGLLEECIHMALKSPHSSMTEAAVWLQGPEACKLLTALVYDGSQFSVNLLTNSFSQTTNGDCLVGNHNARNILIEFNKYIDEYSNSTDDGSGKSSTWITSVAKVIGNCQCSKVLSENCDLIASIVESLFHLKLLNPKDVNLESAWSHCAHGLLRTGNSELINRVLDNCVKATTSLVISNDDDESGHLTESRAQVLMHVVKILGADKPLETSLYIFELVQQQCLDPWLQSLEDAALTALYIRGHSIQSAIKTPGKDPEENWSPLDEVHIKTYLLGALLSSLFLKALFQESCDSSNLRLLEGPLLESKDETSKNFNNFICNHIFALSLAWNLQTFFSNTKQCFEAKPLLHKLCKLALESFEEQPSEIGEDQSVPGLSFVMRESISNLKCKKEENEETDTLDGEFKLSELLSKMTISEEPVVAKIASVGLEIDSMRALRQKLASKEKELETHISFTCWKITTTCKHESTVLFSKQLNGAGASDLMLSSEIARFLAECLRYDSIRMEQKTWDFVLVSTAAWVESLELTTNAFHYTEFVSFVCAVCDLFETMNQIFDGNKELTVFKEWTAVFASCSCLTLLKSWKKLADHCSGHKGNLVVLHHIEALSNCVVQILKRTSLPSIMQNSSNDIKVWASDCVKDCVQLLTSGCPPVQTTAYQILLSLAPHLSKGDVGLTEDMLDKLSIQILQKTLVKTQTVVTTMLQDIKLGVACLVEPFTDAYVYTQAYLFAWLIVIEMFCNSSAEVRQLYTQSIKDTEHLDQLMGALLHLMPEKVLGERGAYVSETMCKQFADELFLSHPLLTKGESSEWLGNLACWTYWRVLRWLPLLARRWYGSAEAAARDLADLVTSRFITPALVDEEIAYARESSRAHTQLSVNCYGSVGGQITATYSLEDSKVQLGISLEHNHPFKPPQLDTSRSCVAGPASQRLRQLALLPTLQNATVWDCIVTWKNCLDKKFEGVEDCYICYSVLTPGTRQLPNFTCRTCRKKFHQACLYKWFTSSSKSTCPICRNLF